MAALASSSSHIGRPFKISGLGRERSLDIYLARSRLQPARPIPSWLTVRTDHCGRSSLFSTLLMICMRAYVEKGKEEEYIYVSVCLRVAILRVIKHVLANCFSTYLFHSKLHCLCTVSVDTLLREGQEGRKRGEVRVERNGKVSCPLVW